MVAAGRCCRGVPRDARSHVRQVIIVAAGIVTEPVAVIMSPAAEQQDARNIDDQPEHGDRYGFVEPDRNRGNQTRDRLVADQQRNHRQDDGAGDSREISKFAGAEAEALVTRMPAGEAVGEGREQQRACSVDICKPSATSAIEPNRKPQTISAIIMTVQSTITIQVRRSACSCLAPRNR